MPEVYVEYSDEDPADLHARRVRGFVVGGDGTEPFATLVRQTIGEEAHAGMLLLAVPPEYGVVAIAVSDKTTLSDVAQFAGDQPLPISPGRIGGQWIIDLWTILGEGLTFLGLLDAARRVKEGGELLHFRKHRTLARQWASLGVDKSPSMELRQCIKAERMWPADIVESKFGLSRQEAVALFRHLGYSYSPDWDCWDEENQE